MYLDGAVLDAACVPGRTVQFVFFGAFAKLRKATVNFVCPSVSVSVPVRPCSNIYCFMPHG